MKIAIVTPSLHYGGAERQVEFLSLGLKAKGHSVTVYCFSDGGAIAETIERGGVKVVALYSRLLSRSAVRALRLLNELYAAVKFFFILLIERPSVAHLYQNQTRMAILAARAAGIRRVVYTETCIIGDWLSPSRLSIMRSFWGLCHAVVALSGKMREHMVGLKAAKAGRIYMVPTMFSAGPSDAVAADGCREKPLNVGIIGRLTPEKGHAFFLKAASYIARARPGINFIIAGDGQMKGELMESAGRLALGGSVEFTGPFRNIEEMMRRIDILVLSSLTEGMPLVLIEGMAYGKPIVATDVGGVRELVLDGETGFVVAPGDPRALADAVVRLADDPKRRSSFAREAISRFRRTYSSESIIPMIESIYRGPEIEGRGDRI